MAVITLFRQPDSMPPTKVVARLLRERIAELWQRLWDQSWDGSQNSVPYDTAWVASLQTAQKTPLFPRTVKWLETT